MSTTNSISSGYFECPVDPSRLENCTICYEDIRANMVAHATINKDGSAAEKKWHHLHLGCLQTWHDQKGKTRKTVTCPTCSKDYRYDTIPGLIMKDSENREIPLLQSNTDLPLSMWILPLAVSVAVVASVFITTVLDTISLIEMI